MTRIVKLSLCSALVCSLISLLSPRVWADASATDKCHAKVVAVASDQLSLDVTLLPPTDRNSGDCKLAGVTKTDATKTDTVAQTPAPLQTGCKPGSDAPCDDTTHLLVTDNRSRIN